MQKLAISSQDIDFSEWQASQMRLAMIDTKFGEKSLHKYQSIRKRKKAIRLVGKDAREQFLFEKKVDAGYFKWVSFEGIKDHKVYGVKCAGFEETTNNLNNKPFTNIHAQFIAFVVNSSEDYGVLMDSAEYLIKIV